MNERAYHEPVLVEEVIHYLAPVPGKVYVDCTVGNAGHTLRILKQIGDEGLVVGFDANALSIETASRRIAQSREKPTHAKLVQGNFADLAQLLKHAQVPPPGGVLLDLGPSNPQLLDDRLGLSWESDSALNMRLDEDPEGLSAAEIVNTWNEEDLTRLFRDNAEERWARKIARTIVEKRKERKIETGRDLGEIVAGAIPRKAWPPKIHPATRVFLALRIEVNDEYGNLEKVLPQALEALESGGRLVVISFHSGEDSRVKRFFREMAKPVNVPPWPLPQKGVEGPPRLKILTKRPVRPSEEEVRRNPRSRSARLRAAEKT